MRSLGHCDTAPPSPSGSASAHPKNVPTSSYVSEPVRNLHCTMQVAPSVTSTPVSERGFAESPRGVLPQILERLWAGRQATRKQMASEPDQFVCKLLNAKQLAQKARFFFAFFDVSFCIFSCKDSDYYADRYCALMPVISVLFLL